MNIKNFFINLGCGAAIGVAMIIPGVSGGTVAVLFNKYDRLISSISGLRRDFKNSISFLLPILLGAVLAFAAIYIPLTILLEAAPLPTVLLFAGLMLGSFPKLFKDGIKQGFKKTDVISVVIPPAKEIGICFIPSLGDVNLGNDMPVYGYFLLIVMGALASCALVVPGISGSMLLLICGYYQPVLNTIKALFSSAFGHSFLVLFLFAAGLIAGFFSIARLMKFFFTKFPRTTYWAIIGFVIGSIPAIFITYPSNFPPYETCTPLHIGIGVLLCVAGAIATFALTSYAESRKSKTEHMPLETDTDKSE